MFVPKKAVPSPANIADGEYTAEVSKLRMTKDNESVMFICKLTTPGFEEMELPGFARANWNKPTGRTTANLYQWVKNLGGMVTEGQEDLFDLETLKGAPCRVIVQAYNRKDGSSAIKISNILPISKKPVPNPMPVKTGLHVGTAQAVQPAAAEPAAEPAAATTSGSESTTPDLW